MLVARPAQSYFFPSLSMQNSIDMEDTPVLSGEENVPGDSVEEKQEASPRSSVDPKNQQEYWRWVQLQLLRERAGRTIPRE